MSDSRIVLAAADAAAATDDNYDSKLIRLITDILTVSRRGLLCSVVTVYTLSLKRKPNP